MTSQHGSLWTFNTYDLLWIINIQWLCTSSRTTNVLNNETNINPIKRHCCLWLTFWILNNTHNAPLLSRGLPQVTFDLPGTCWIQIKCCFVLLRMNKLNPSARTIGLSSSPARNTDHLVKLLLGIHLQEILKLTVRQFKSVYETNRNLPVVFASSSQISNTKSAYCIKCSWLFRVFQRNQGKTKWIKIIIIIHLN